MLLPSRDIYKAKKIPDFILPDIRKNLYGYSFKRR